ncbi:MAG: ATP-binding protein [Pyrinomonadaceae bacterium]|nr:ATP-binding protein [Pyrinomonadaceae bacterium]
MERIERKFLLKVPSSTENLALIREFVTSAAQQAGFDASEIAKLELAVDEACANVIEHAYGGQDVTKEVVVRATLDDEALSIDIEDTGRGFDPDSIKQEELEELINKRKTGGLGMRLMKSLMDEVHYEIEPGKKNALHMVKRLRKT